MVLNASKKQRGRRNSKKKEEHRFPSASRKGEDSFRKKKTRELPRVTRGCCSTPVTPEDRGVPRSLDNTNRKIIVKGGVKRGEDKHTRGIGKEHVEGQTGSGKYFLVSDAEGPAKRSIKWAAP